MKINKTLVIPSLSGFQYGYNSTIIAAALLFLKKTFSLSPFEEGFLVGMPIAGLWLASFSSILANYIGRKTTLFLGVFFFILGALLSTIATHYVVLLLGRFLIGAGSGISLVVAPIYLVEMAPVETRGRIINLNQVGIAAGTLLAYICGYLLCFTENWRGMFAIGLIPAFVQLLGLFLIPESLHKEKREELRSHSSWGKLWDPSYRSRLRLIIFLSFFQAFSGASSVFFYAPIVFENVGFLGTQASLFSTIWIGVLYLVAILVSFAIVDRMGRRFLLIGSLLGMGLSLLTIFFFFYFQFAGHSLVSFICILAYITFFSLGTGPIPPLIVGEISPLTMRGHAMTLMGTAGWLWNYIVATSFLPGVAFIATEGVFLIYACLCLMGSLFFWRMLPETKQKSSEEIETIFRK